MGYSSCHSMQTYSSVPTDQFLFTHTSRHCLNMKMKRTYPSSMIKLLHLPIRAPNGVFLVTKTTSLCHPSFTVSVRLVLVPWRVLIGKVG
jgi:hypothetical protein